MKYVGRLVLLAQTTLIAGWAAILLLALVFAWRRQRTAYR